MLEKIDTSKYIPVVLCAGFGTRLKPLTQYLPKVICPVLDTPVAFLSIEIFLKAGFEKVHCNTHYLAFDTQKELTSSAIKKGYDPARIIFWHEEEILETGGGISRIFHSLKNEDPANSDKDIIVVSGDIAAQFPLTEMIYKWENKESEELALMCTKELNYFRKDATWVTKDLKYVIGFGENFQSNEDKIPRIFTTHQIISHKILINSFIEKKSSIDLFYRKILQNNYKIAHMEFPNNNYWFDIGTPKQYFECIKYFNLKNNSDDSDLIINYSENIPKKLKDLIEQFANEHPNYTFYEELLYQKIIICFRDLNINNRSMYIPLNLFEKSETDNNFIIHVSAK
ncbi:nucleotidyltransferase family protein [Fluviispira vulneris]|uniref:nucleotidyltransferase family protein n=1 Tax=Fluviispira vulneris TaxID=2763012 RepID=UPI0016494A66|nr:sugar phosphate nucleotidyltransferase [Fluviispira vulneris]